jgi:hypothetical protein
MTLLYENDFTNVMSHIKIILLNSTSSECHVHFIFKKKREKLIRFNFLLSIEKSWENVAKNII